MQHATPEQVRRGVEQNTEGASTRSGLDLRRATEAIRRAGQQAARVNRLDWRTREAIYRQEPFFLRCVDKQTGDLVKHGFKVVKVGDEDKHQDDDLVQAWFEDTDAWGRIRESLIGSHLHGDGPVEIEWDDGGDPRSPVADDALPVAVHVIDPVGVKFIKERDGDRDLVFLVQQNLNGGQPVVLHPDRWHHLFFHRLPGMLHAIASVEVAYHALLAKVKGDQGTGELVYNAGQPKVHAAIKDPRPDEIDETIEMVNNPDFVRGYVTDDRTAFDQLNPVVFNPTPFYAEWKGSAAAAVGLPIALAEGVQAGEVTGSETNLTDYHSDLRLAEVLVLEPLVKRVIKGLLGDTKFRVKWNDPPTLPSAEATQRRDKANALNQFLAAGLTKEAAAREAGLKLSEDDFEEEPEGVLPPVEPGPDGQPPRPTVPRLPPGTPPPAPGRPAPPPLPAA